VPIAISAEQRARQASIRDWATKAGTLALVRRLEPGSTAEGPGSLAGPPASPTGPPGGPVGVAHEKTPWAEHWAALAGLGVFSIALPEAAGDAVYAFLLSRCLSLAGGTSQILLSVVAERALGLPRDEAR
jgi:alkylation response protein AidB-like acyl-CoA dehydrogenase